MAETPLAHQLEAVLFVASEPVSATQLAQATGATDAQVSQALAQLTASLQSGLRLSQLDDRYRLVTAPAAAPAVRRFLQTEAKSDLTRPALETLAIIAYRGPVTKAAIDQIRGVASDTMLRNLQSRGLITEAGNSPEPGRPLLYAVSHNFLHHFGLASPSDLPPIPDAARSDNPAAPASAPDETVRAH